MRSLLIFAGLIAATEGFMFAFPRENLNQNASLSCFKSGNTCTMEVIITSADNPNRLFFENADRTANTVSTQSNLAGSLISGLGTVGTPWNITIDVDCDAVSATGEAADALGVYDGQTLRTVIVVSQNYDPAFAGIDFPLDVRYAPACNFSMVGSGTVESRQLFISGGNDENAGDPQVDSAVLTARLDSDPNTPVNSVVEGDLMFWHATINDAANSPARGLRLYSCQICDLADCSGINFAFVLDNGCSSQPGFFTAFTDTTNPTATTGNAVTSSFKAFQLNSPSSIFYLRCGVSFCYTPNDPACRDLCGANTGRKKRQAEEPEGDNNRTVLAIISIRPYGEASVQIDGKEVKNNEQESQPAVKESQSPKTEAMSGLMVAVIVLSVMVAAVIVVTIIAYFYISNKNRSPANKA